MKKIIVFCLFITILSFTPKLSAEVVHIYNTEVLDQSYTFTDTFYVHQGALVINENWVNPTLTVGTLINEGTFRNNTWGTLTVVVHANVYQYGTMSNSQVQLNGIDDQHIEVAADSTFACGSFVVNNSTGDIIADTDLSFTGTNINFNDFTLDLSAGVNLSIDGNYLYGTNIIGSTSRTPSKLILTNSSHLHNVSANNITIDGLANIHLGCTFDNLILEGILQNREWETVTMTLTGEFINTGTLQDNLYRDFTVNIQGNIANNGIITNNKINLTGTTTQHLLLAENLTFANANFINENTSGNIIADTDLNFLGTNIDFNNHTLDLSAGVNLSIDGNYLYGTNIIGSTSRVPSKLILTNSSHLHNVNASDITIDGLANVSFGCTFDNLILEGVLQNKEWDAVTMTLTGDFINTGTLRDNLYRDFIVDIQENITNNGVITNNTINLTGTTAQHLSQAENSTFANANFYNSNTSENIIADSDLSFTGTNVNFQHIGSLDLTAGYDLNISGNYLYQTAVLGGNGATINLTGNAYIQDITAENITLSGTLIHKGTSTYTGSLTNIGTIINPEWDTGVLNINGNLTNDSIITDWNGRTITLNITGNVANNGTWNNTLTKFIGNTDQTIFMENNNYLTGDVRFVSDVTGSAYQWNFNSAPLDSPNFAGETSVELDWNVPVNSDYVGTYNCDVSSRTLSRNIIVNEPIDADFSASSTEITLGQTIDFTDTSAGVPATWAWDFDGDDITDSADQNPTWEYAASGIYTVKLTITDGRTEDTETKIDYITVNEPSITEGLVAHYPFEGNANDFSGNDHHGTNYGATLTTDRFGNAGYAYDFDGSNDYMDLGNWFNYQDFTISMWVNREATGSSWRTLLDNNHGPNWVIQSYETSNDFSFGVYPDGGVDFTIDLSQWEHIVCIKDGTTIKTYIGGVLENTSTMSATVTYSNPNLFLARWGGGGRFFNGKIDDIRMFDRALAYSEIDMLFTDGDPEPIMEMSLVSDSEIDFGTIYYGLDDTQEVIIRNDGNVDLSVSDVSLSAGSSSTFSYTYDNLGGTIAPGAINSIFVTFTPDAEGNFAGTLEITNNSTNNPLIQVSLSGTGEYDEIPAPQNVTIVLDGGDATISWDAVTQTVHGIPVTIDFYVINYSDDPGVAPDDFLHLAITSNLSHIHTGVVWFADQMFYEVIAIRDYEGQYNSIRNSINPHTEKITWKNFKQRYFN